MPDNQECPDAKNHLWLGLAGIAPCGPNCRYDSRRLAFEAGYNQCLIDFERRQKTGGVTNLMGGPEILNPKESHAVFVRVRGVNVQTTPVLIGPN